MHQLLVVVIVVVVIGTYVRTMHACDVYVQSADTFPSRCQAKLLFH